VVTDEPVEVMKSVEVMAPTSLPVKQLVEQYIELPVARPEAKQVTASVEQFVVAATLPESVAAQSANVQQPSSAQPTSWLSWLKQQLLGATKK
jgi:hypothetical protein